MKPKLVYGRKPVLEAIQSGSSVEKVIIQKGTRGEFEKEIRYLTRELDIPLQYAPKERINKMTSGNHQGIIAWISLLPFTKLENILPLIYEKGEVPLFVILEGVTDVRNFGAIARSAEVAGVHAIVIPGKGAAQINEDAFKSSAGALNIIPVCREISLVNALNFLKDSGVRIFAAELQGAKPLYELDLLGPSAILLGSEGEGLSKSLLSLSDQRYFIPQKGQTDSFNVSVAAGISFYEVMRQRGSH